MERQITHARLLNVHSSNAGLPQRDVIVRIRNFVCLVRLSASSSQSCGCGRNTAFRNTRTDLISSHEISPNPKEQCLSKKEKCPSIYPSVIKRH